MCNRHEGCRGRWQLQWLILCVLIQFVQQVRRFCQKLGSLLVHSLYNDPRLRKFTFILLEGNNLTIYGHNVGSKFGYGYIVGSVFRRYLFLFWYMEPQTETHIKACYCQIVIKKSNRKSRLLPYNLNSALYFSNLLFASRLMRQTRRALNPKGKSVSVQVPLVMIA